MMADPQTLLRRLVALHPSQGNLSSDASLSSSALAVWTKEDFLREWLQELVVEIPEASFLEGGFNITLSEIRCTQFRVDSIASSRPADLRFALDASAAGVGADCAMAWRYHATAVPLVHDSGTVHAVVGGDSSISGPLQVVMDDDQVAPLPKQVHTRDCHGSLTLTDLKFGGKTLGDVILEVLTGVIKKAMSLLPPLLCKELDQAIDKLDLETLTDSLRKRALAPPKALKPLEIRGDDIFNWNDDRFFAAIERTVQALGNVSGKAGINTILARALGSDEGNVSLWTRGQGEPQPFLINVLQLGTCQLRIPELSLSGLASFRSLSLQHEAAHNLSISFATALRELKAAGTCNLLCRPVDPHISGPPLSETFSFSLALANVSFNSLGDCAVAGNQLTDQLLSKPRECLPGAIAGAQLRTLGGELLPQKIDILPTSGDSLEQGLDALIGNMLSLGLDALGPSIPILGNGFLRSEGRDSINEKLPAFPGPACPPGPPPDEYAFYTASTVCGVMSVVFILPALMLFCQRHVLRNRKFQRRDLELSSNAEDALQRERPFASATEPAFGTAELPTRPLAERRLLPPLPSWECLASHPAVGQRASVGVPLLLAANALLFLCSNLTVGVKVGIVLVLAEDRFELPNVFDFGLVNSILDMYGAGSYALAILIGLFSGCWPYLKLLLMAVCWYSSPERLPHRHRKALLEFLDAYGKWSLVDSFVLVLFMVSFYIDISAQSPVVQAAVGDVGPLFDFTVVVRPQLGFYVFLIATILSLVAGHLVTSYERKASDHESSETTLQDEELKRGMHAVAGVPRIQAVMVPLALLASVVVVLAGATVESFRFDFSGLAQVALGKDDSHRSYSLISLGQKVSAASEDPGSFGVFCIQATFFLFTLIVIVAYHCLMIFLWLWPLHRNQQKKLLVFTQVLQAWSSLDVFVISIAACVAEIGELVTFIVGDRCDAIEQVLRDPPAVLAAKLPHSLLEHPSCVEIGTSLKPGYWCLLAGALVSTVLGQAVIKLLGNALESHTRAAPAA